MTLLDSAGGGIAGLAPTIQVSSDGTNWADIDTANDTDEDGMSWNLVLNGADSYGLYTYYRAYVGVYGTTHYSKSVINL